MTNVTLSRQMPRHVANARLGLRHRAGDGFLSATQRNRCGGRHDPAGRFDLGREVVLPAMNDVYLSRLAAFVFIIAAIADKNRNRG
jgi:hypothetical protein